MEKITGVLQRWRKNILNNNMDKLEKCYYAIIENKKRGKFSGAGPIEVAKKVASKKLKTGKEMEFYLDEVAGKKKRLGPYQARKDKKSGKVAVVKARKVMKGGLLSSREQEILIRIFNNNCSYLKRLNKQEIPFIKQFSFNDIKFYFVVPSVLIFFKKNDKEQSYSHAIFVDPNRTYVWILKKQLNNSVIFINFDDFFLNPNYLNESEREYIIQNLNKNLNKNLPFIRREESNIIQSILSKIWSVIVDKNGIWIYSPDYSHPLIKKCVYPDLTFGVLNEENPAQRDIRQFEVPKSSNQKFLILTNTGIRGMSFNEPIIYVRVVNIPQNQLGGTNMIKQIQAQINSLNQDLNKLKKGQLYFQQLVNKQNVLNPMRTIGFQFPQLVLNQEKQNREFLNNLNNEITKIETEIKTLQQLQQQQLQQQQQQQLQQKQPQLQQQKPLQFDYCIYSSGNQLKIMSNNSYNIQDFMRNNLISINIQILQNLMDIPRLFGEFRRIKNVCKEILEEQQEQQERQIILEAQQEQQIIFKKQQERQIIFKKQQNEISKLNNEYNEYKKYSKNQKPRQNFNSNYSRQLVNEIR